MIPARSRMVRWSNLQQSVKEGERQEEKHNDMLYIYTNVTPILSIAVVPNPDIITLEGVL
jgi:hypothetical protein